MTWNELLPGDMLMISSGESALIVANVQENVSNRIFAFVDDKVDVGLYTSHETVTSVFMVIRKGVIVRGFSND